MKTVSYFIEYCLVKILAAIIYCLPRGLTLRLGAAVGSLLCACGIRKKVVQQNMRHVGIWNEHESAEIIKNLYRNMGRYAADFFRSLPGFYTLGDLSFTLVLFSGAGQMTH